MVTRYLPLVGMIAFVAIGFVWRGWLQYRTYGHSGIALFRASDLRHRLRDAIFCLLFAAIILQTVVLAVQPSWLEGLLIFAPPAWMVIAGSLLLFGGLLLTVAAQLGMGASWRIGIDPSAKPGLVTAGLYQFCRNPIYLGLLGSLLGLAIILPTWLSAVFLIGVVWCVRTQVLEEEAYLQSVYGQEFENYAAQIGRFMPGVGRLPLKTTT